jgi:hypothetical protein
MPDEAARDECAAVMHVSYDYEIRLTTKAQKDRRREGGIGN